MLFLRDPWPDTVPALTSELYIPGGKQGIESEENRRNQQRSGNAARAIETNNEAATRQGQSKPAPHFDRFW
jgi:hypothetical protein